MKPSSLFFTLAQLAFIGSADAAKCNADNCARAATGTFRGLGSARASACTSFQRCTVSGAATTVTTTSTVTVAAAMAARFHVVHKEKRQAGTAVTSCPSAIPTFASTCVSSRYASACSCFGVTKSYTTVAGSTVTVTAQTTVTATEPPVTTTSTTTPIGTAPTGTAPTGTSPSSSSSSSTAPVTAPTATAPTVSAPSGGIPTTANSTVAFPAIPATVVSYVRL